ncbi:pilus assembly protein PilM [Lachnoclostridium edouardi]|uniref:pilus assembly protein PilM n=1 Tax=Lachnoclostridium edouardi TaxID=1926283 RepID=UPI000C7B7B0D|nr:pilus assembly protein PilM [Lachnoclostridium edouardi]
MKNILAVSFGSKEIRVGEFKKSGNKIIIKKLAKMEISEDLADNGLITDPHEGARVLKKIIKENGLTGTKVIFSVTSGKIMNRQVTLPYMKKQYIAETIRSNGENYFPIGISQYVLAYFKMSVQETKRQEIPLIALAAPDHVIQSYYETAALAGLQTVSVDYSGNSIFQAVSAYEEKSPLMVIFVSAGLASFSVIRDSRLMFQRNISCAHILKEQEGRENSGERTAYMEGIVDRIWEYYMAHFPDQPVDSVLLLGEEIEELGLESICRKLKLQKKSLGIPERICLSEGLSIDGEEYEKYLAVLGAAIHPVGFKPAYMEQEEEKRRQTCLYGALVLAAVSVCFIAGGRPFIERTRLLDTKSALEKELQSIYQAEEIYENFQNGEKQKADLKEIDRLTKEGNKNLIDFIELLKSVRPKDMTILTFASNEGKVSISALAERKESVIEFINSLKASHIVSETDISPLFSTFSADGEQLVSFSVTCVLGSGQEDEKYMLEENKESGQEEEEIYIEGTQQEEKE